MDSRKDISQLNWALAVYSDVVKFGTKSNRLDESKLCLGILEQFEEYEKCYDMFLVLTQNAPGILERINSKKKNGRS
jgi:hypothetical protein